MSDLSALLAEQRRVAEGATNRSHLPWVQAVEYDLENDPDRNFAANFDPDTALAYIAVAEDAEEYHGWLYAIWMAFLADEDLTSVLQRMSAFMQENETPAALDHLETVLKEKR